MMSTHADDDRVGNRAGPTAAPPAAVFAVIATAELLALIGLFNFGVDFECPTLARPAACDFVTDGLTRFMAVAAAVGLVLAATPKHLAALLQSRVAPSRSWLTLHGLGLALIALQATAFENGMDMSSFRIAAGFLAIGGLMAGVGFAFSFAPPMAWRTMVKGFDRTAWIALAVAVLAPEIRDAIRDLWSVDQIARVTLDGVMIALDLAGSTVETMPDYPFVVGVGDFLVNVGRPCSGVEGFALITGFSTLYMALFRDQLRFPRAFLLIPVGIAVSWVLNIVRIAALILIGAHVSPELAVNGFHSHAGWLMFTLLSLGLVFAAHTSPWLRRDGQSVLSKTSEVSPSAPPLFRDPIAAQILPFVVFMATALLASTFSETPNLYYPLRALAVILALAAFHHVLRGMTWRFDRVAVLSGCVIGLLWIVTAPPAADSDVALNAALAALPGWLFVIWATSRIAGTAVLVPLVEELFFRGYILSRIDRGGVAMRVLAVAVSAGLFAALHGRWFAAALAGLVFVWLALRRRDGLTDAVVAHGVANAVIAAWALRTGDWSII